MRQDFPSTSQDLIQALKAPADPPGGHALSKIQIATRAWSQSTLYFPNKDQVIADWILTRLLKEKDKPSLSNPLIDVDHWRLLSTIVCCNEIEGSRRVKAWLTPLLNRTPFAPIFIAFLDQIHHLPPEGQTAILDSFTLCFSVLWPLAKHKIDVETLLECFSATLKCFFSDASRRLAQSHHALCSAVANTYLPTLTRAPNRKKLSSVFLSNHLEIWLRCVPVFRSSGGNDFYCVGAETLFPLETLRQLIDNPTTNPVVQALSRIDCSIMLPSLPALLESFHEFASRNRAGLFSHSQRATLTTTDNVCAATIGFYDTCDDLVSASHVDALSAWHARIRLLSIIEEKNVFSNAHQELKLTLSGKCRLVVEELRSHTTNTAELVLNLICRFSRIDFDLVSPCITSVLPVVAKLSSSSRAAAEFLELGLDHHKKTRTLPIYFSMILGALEQTKNSIDPHNPHNTYAVVLGGPIFEDSHVEKLRKSLRAFVTPGQCLGFLSQTRSALEQANPEYSRQNTPEAKTSKRPRKRRKLDLESAVCSSVTSINFAFVCSLIAIVWPSLPIRSLAEEFRSEAVKEIQGVNTSVIKPLLSTGFKQEYDEEGGGASRTWPRDITTCSVLRLQYVLSTCPAFSFQSTYDTEMESRMLGLLEPSGVLPELKIEIGRALLIRASTGALKDVEVLVGRILSCMKPVDPFHNESWGGKVFQLSRCDKGSPQLTAALLHILSHRWLPTLSDSAAADDLQHFVRLLFSPISEMHASRGNSVENAESLAAVAPLQSPAFWEVPELRSAVLAYLSKETSYPDVADVVTTLENLAPSDSLSLDIPRVRTVYTVLRYTPMEYLPRSVRTDLTRKAIALDARLISVSEPRSAVNDLMDALSLLREFMSRSMVHVAAFEKREMDAITKYLLDPRWNTSAESPIFPSAITGRLIGAHLGAVLRSYRPDNELGVLTVIRCAQPSAVSLQNASRQSLLAIVLETMMRGSQASRFSARVSQDLRSLLSSTLGAIENAVTRFTSTGTHQERDIFLMVTHLRLWCTLISLRTWISGIDIPVPKLAAIVTKKILAYGKTGTVPTLYNLAVLVSLSELSTVSADEAPQASELFLAVYLSLSRANRALGSNDLVGGLVPFQSLPARTYEIVLASISEFCLGTTASSGDIVSMVRLSQVLLRNAPEGTMKVMQKYTTDSLNFFLNRQQLWFMDTNISLEFCKFISTACAEGVAALRPSDVMSIWTIISKLLSGSENHDATTSVEVFREIVGIANALIRHRRDLVLPALPHLSMILQRLVALIRVARPGLGAKQARAVANSFPFWVNSREPLGISEVKVLSRLLVSLTAKTIVRAVGSTQENQKMESLARPLGKHASHVLVACVQAMNDPLCVVYATTRKELYPGLFALCEMLSDNDREAMMLSALDGGGKVAMKTVWNDYRKQKYVGQG